MLRRAKPFRDSVVKFYLGQAFILFDWRSFSFTVGGGLPESITQSTTILWSMLSFITILMVGYAYALKKGALDWKK